MTFLYVKMYMFFIRVMVIWTIAARTNLYVRHGEKEENSTILQAAENIRKLEMDSIMLEKYRVFQEAARET